MVAEERLIPKQETTNLKRAIVAKKPIANQRAIHVNGGMYLQIYPAQC
jgi:hypothetical protein